MMIEKQFLKKRQSFLPWLWQGLGLSILMLLMLSIGVAIELSWLLIGLSWLWLGFSWFWLELSWLVGLWLTLSWLTFGLLMIIIMGVFGLYLWLGLGLILFRLIKPYKKSFKNVPISKTQLNRWIHQFLSDEEKAAILIDYRIVWYGNKRPNKWIRFKVWLKTMHYLFYEV